MKSLRTQSTRSGFTLVELLVVIGIIALLISILLPTLNRAREAANTAKCLANQRSVAQAAMMHSSERGVLPTTSGKFLMTQQDESRRKWEYRTDPTGVEPGGLAKDWASMLIRYLGDKSQEASLFNGVGTRSSTIQVFQCPSDPALDIDATPGYRILSNQNPNNFFPISIGYNIDIASLVDRIDGFARWTDTNGSWNGGSSPANRGWSIGVVHGADPRNVYGGLQRGMRIGQSADARLNRVKGASEVAMFMDAGVRSNSPPPSIPLDGSDIPYISSNYAMYGTAAVELSGTLEGMAGASWLNNKIAANRHSPKNGPGGTVLPQARRVNVTFADGHGETASRDRWKDVRISPFVPVGPQ